MRNKNLTDLKFTYVVRSVVMLKSLRRGHNTTSEGRMLRFILLGNVTQFLTRRRVSKLGAHVKSDGFKVRLQRACPLPHGSFAEQNLATSHIYLGMLGQRPTWTLTVSA